jgi:hypothetical protein
MPRILSERDHTTLSEMIGWWERRNQTTEGRNFDTLDREEFPTPETYIAHLSTGSTIPARVGTVPGSGECSVYRILVGDKAELLPIDGLSRVVYNISDSVIDATAAEMWFPVQKDKYGTWFVSQSAGAPGIPGTSGDVVFVGWLTASSTGGGLWNPPRWKWRKLTDGASPGTESLDYTAVQFPHDTVPPFGPSLQYNPQVGDLVYLRQSDAVPTLYDFIPYGSYCDISHPGIIKLGNQTLGTGRKRVDELDIKGRAELQDWTPNNSGGYQNAIAFTSIGQTLSSLGGLAGFPSGNVGANAFISKTGGGFLMECGPSMIGGVFTWHAYMYYFQDVLPTGVTANHQYFNGAGIAGPTSGVTVDCLLSFGTRSSSIGADLLGNMWLIPYHNSVQFSGAIICASRLSVYVRNPNIAPAQYVQIQGADYGFPSASPPNPGPVFIYGLYVGGNFSDIHINGGGF